MNPRLGLLRISTILLIAQIIAKFAPARKSKTIALWPFKCLERLFGFQNGT